MLNRVRTKSASDEGFTLVEMLIVIVVLGILAGITVFGVATFKGDSETAACKADVKTVSIAAQAYNAQKGTYPADVAALVALNYLHTSPATTVALSSAGVASATCGGAAYSA